MYRIESKYNFNHKTVAVLTFDNDVCGVQTLIHSLFSVQKYYVADVASLIINISSSHMVTKMQRVVEESDTI